MRIHLCPLRYLRSRPEECEGIPNPQPQPAQTGTKVPILALFHYDCQQLLQVLFTTEERELILSEAPKNVPGVDGRPTTQPNLIDEGFPLMRPRWDFERAKGRERL